MPVLTLPSARRLDNTDLAVWRYARAHQPQNGNPEGDAPRVGIGSGVVFTIGQQASKAGLPACLTQPEVCNRSEERIPRSGGGDSSISVADGYNSRSAASGGGGGAGSDADVGGLATRLPGLGDAARQDSHP